jgi:hypothetical protein
MLILLLDYDAMNVDDALKSISFMMLNVMISGRGMIIVTVHP